MTRYDALRAVIEENHGLLLTDDAVDCIVLAILSDVTDRRGWGQAWDSFNRDIQREIIEVWRDLVAAELEDETVSLDDAGVPSADLVDLVRVEEEPRAGIRPDPLHLAALALSGALPDAQAEQILRDVGVARAVEVPRHLRIALANAQRAFERDDLGALATVNEDIQGLADAAVAWGRRRTEDARAWREGALGAAAIARPPRQGAHTEEAYSAHRVQYETGPEAYRQGADVVSEVDLRRRQAEEERDAARQACSTTARERDEILACATQRGQEALDLRVELERTKRAALVAIREAEIAGYIAGHTSAYYGIEEGVTLREAAEDAAEVPEHYLCDAFAKETP